MIDVSITTRNILAGILCVVSLILFIVMEPILIFTFFREILPTLVILFPFTVGGIIYISSIILFSFIVYYIFLSVHKKEPIFLKKNIDQEIYVRGGIFFGAFINLLESITISSVGGFFKNVPLYAIFWVLSGLIQIVAGIIYKSY